MRRRNQSEVASRKLAANMAKGSETKSSRLKSKGGVKIDVVVVDDVDRRPLDSAEEFIYVIAGSL